MVRFSLNVCCGEVGEEDEREGAGVLKRREGESQLWMNPTHLKENDSI